MTIPFKGFIIQARTQLTSDLVGSFVLINVNKTRLQECQLSAEDPVSRAVSWSGVMLAFKNTHIIGYSHTQQSG